MVVTLPLPLCDLGKITLCPHPWRTGTAQTLCLTWVQGEPVRTLGRGDTGGGGSGGAWQHPKVTQLTVSSWGRGTDRSRRRFWAGTQLPVYSGMPSEVIQG